MQTANSVDATYVAAGRQSYMNYGSSDRIIVGRTMNESNWGYIKFPTLYNFCKSKSYIQSGTLTLVETNESEKGKFVRFYKTTGSWDTNTITYSNRPDSESGSYSSIVTTGVANTTKTVTLTNYMNTLRNSLVDFAKNGFLISPADVNNDSIQSAATFYSPRSSVAGYRPKLTIAYYDKPTKAASFVVAPFQQNTGRNIAVAYTGVKSPALSYVQYKVEKYNDTTKSTIGTYIPYSSNTVIGTGENGSAAIDTSTWPEGCYQISIRGMDRYSAIGAESSQILHLDLTKPKIDNCFQFTDNSTSIRNYSSEVSTISWSGITEQHLESIEMQANGGAYYEIGNTLKGQYTVPVTQMKQGTNVFKFRVRDTSGNISETVSESYYYDNEKPTLSADLSVATSLAKHSNQSDITLNYRANDSNLYQIQYSMNGGSYNTFAYCAAEGRVTLPESFYEGGAGVKNVKVRAIDLAGNISNEVSLDYYYDAVLPIVNATLIPTSDGRTYLTDIPRLDYSVEDSTLSQIKVSIDGTSHLLRTNQPSGSIQLPADWFTDTGIYSIRMTAEDKAGNHASKCFNYHYVNMSVTANDYFPQNVSVQECADGSTEIFWDKAYDLALPFDIAYFVYSGRTADFTPSEDCLVGRNIKGNRAFISRREESGTYYYKICAKKVLPTGVVMGTSPYVTVSSTTAPAQEMVKRLGEEENYGYVDFNTPNGSGKIERSQGNFFYQQTDASLPCGNLSFDLTRSYNSLKGTRGVLGAGWTSWYEMRVYEADGKVILESGDGSGFTYEAKENNQYCCEKDEDSYLQKDAANGIVTYQQIFKDGTKYHFNKNGRLIKAEEANGSWLEILYDINERFVDKIITHSSAKDTAGQLNREVLFSYEIGENGKALLHKLTLSNGASLTYSYENDRLTEVKCIGEGDKGEVTYRYEYQNGKLSKIYDAKGDNAYQLTYADGKVSKCTYPDGTYLQMTYDAALQSSCYKRTPDNGELV